MCQAVKLLVRRAILYNLQHFYTFLFVHHDHVLNVEIEFRDLIFHELYVFPLAIIFFFLLVSISESRFSLLSLFDLVLAKVDFGLSNSLSFSSFVRSNGSFRSSKIALFYRKVLILSFELDGLASSLLTACTQSTNDKMKIDKQYSFRQ